MVQSKSQVSAIESVRSALLYLSGQCDGAVEQDGVGFNGSDSCRGKSMAAVVAAGERLSGYKLLSAAEMLQKYRKQLASGGIELATLEEVQSEIDRTPIPFSRSRQLIKKQVEPDPIAVETADAPKYDVLAEKPWLASEWRSGLSEQQCEAFDRAHEWFFNSPDAPFVITGKPGTGKSYTVQRIVRSIAAIYETQHDRRLKVALTAPTHRARAVLESFANAIGLQCHIATMHSLLHLIPGKPDHNGRTHFEVNAWSKEPYWAEFDLVCGDEQSMTGKDLFEFIPSNVAAILMGDERQLAPVEGDEDRSTFEVSPVFSLPCGVNLTQVMRYDGQLAYYVDAIADSIDAKSQFPPYLGKFEKRNSNLIRIPSQADWEAEMIETFKDVDLTQEPNGVRAIAWTNKRVNELNSMVRFALTGVSPESLPFIEGDRVMAKEPIFRLEMTEWGEKKQTIMKTCDEGVVTAVFADKMEFRGETVKLNRLDVASDESGFLEVLTVHPESRSMVDGWIAEAKSNALKAEDKRDKKKFWREYYEMLEVFNLVAKGQIMQRLQYAFASTCHQSQGGTYRFVFSDHQNLMQCREPETRSRLIYVASSRASEQLIAHVKH